LTVIISQHVVYVPATAALPPSQYAYAPVPLAAPRQHHPASQQGGGASTSTTSPFAAPQYQSYAAPPANLGQGQGSPNPSAAGAGGSQASGYPNNAAQQGGQGQGGQNGSRFGVATGAYGAPQPPPQDQRGLGLNPQQQQQQSSSYGGMPNPAFSPPGGNYPGLVGDTPPGSATFGFAPFSPPSFHHAPLFGAPPPGPQAPHSLSQQAYPPQQAYPQQPSYSRQASSTHPSSPPQSSAGGGGGGSIAQSALFGSTRDSSSPAPPAPIGTGSRSATPSGAQGGRSTPSALGNGSLGSDAWKVTPPSSSNGANGNGGNGVLYTSNGDGK